jgi:hypothetical protein
MRKILVAVLLTLAAVVPVVPTAPAGATASGCSTAWTGYTAASTCWSGSGRFRVVAQTGWGSAARYWPGPCVLVGFISRVYTTSPVVYAYKAGC